MHISNVNEIVNKLDVEIKEVFATGVFIYPKHWEKFTSIIEQATKENISFVCNATNYYDISEHSFLEKAMEQFSRYKKLTPEKHFIVKYQKYEIASIVSQEINDLIKEIRNYEPQQVLIKSSFFNVYGENCIEIKQFKNLEFNNYFLQMFGYNV
jgi:hypothetical protein